MAGDWRIGGSGIHFGTVGFVGYGAIAKNVKVPNKLVFNSKNTKEDLLKLAENSNTLVITIPQTKETKQQELLDTGKVTNSKHTAWSTGFSYDEKYFVKLETVISNCLNNKVDNPTLPRKKKNTLWDT